MAEFEFDYVRDLALEAARNQDLRDEIVRDPVGALTRHQRRTLPAEGLQLLTVPVLALVVLGVLGLAAYFGATGKTLPQEIVALGSLALGGLVGLKAGHQ